MYGGGSHPGSCLDTIEYMPFKTNGTPENFKWASISVENFTPRIHTLMVPINQKILIAGGLNSKFSLLSDAKILDMNQKKSVCTFDTSIKFACRGDKYCYNQEGKILVIVTSGRSSKLIKVDAQQQNAVVVKEF